MAEQRRFLVAENSKGPFACVCSSIQGMDDDWELYEGIPQDDEKTANIHVSMEESFPRNIQLEDFVWNMGNLPIVSSRVVELVTSFNPSNVQIFPVTIFNHKGRSVKKPYFLMHTVHHPDCLDPGASGARPNRIDPSVFSRVERLVFDENGMDPSLAFVRLHRLFNPLLVNRKLVSRMLAEKITGIQFIETSDWGRRS